MPIQKRWPNHHWPGLLKKINDRAPAYYKHQHAAQWVGDGFGDVANLRLVSGFMIFFFFLAE
jgi:hypothetical protein